MEDYVIVLLTVGLGLIGFLLGWLLSKRNYYVGFENFIAQLNITEKTLTIVNNKTGLATNVPIDPKCTKNYFEELVEFLQFKRRENEGDE